MRVFLTVILFLIGTSSASLFMLGEQATQSANRPIGPPPFDLPIKAVSFKDKLKQTVKAWSITGKAGQGVVVLVHGINSDRRSMLGRARMLVKAGYSVLLADLQAHGESPGDKITFGYLEANSVSAAVKFSRQRWPGKKLAVIGASLGGAAAVVAARVNQADAYILEAVYSSLYDATANRMEIKFGALGRYITPALLWQVPLRLGFPVDDLSIVDRIRNIKAPLMIIAGEKDTRTTLENSKAIFANAARP